MNEFLQIVQQTHVPIPTIELLVLLIILTVSLVFKSTRIGLLMAYLFVFRWGWLFIQETFQRTERDVSAQLSHLRRDRHTPERGHDAQSSE